ncbi:hypothetical protein [Methylovulum sp.]|nr:hypothetical protein [Methylovulum sp.]MDD5125010.1 hypothetical protein [Methylovulum sp.]
MPNHPDSPTLGTMAQSPPDNSQAKPTAKPRPERNTEGLIDSLTQNRAP